MAPIREGGGSDNWIWRGESSLREARVEAILEGPFAYADTQQLRYSLAFGHFFSGTPSLTEEIERVGGTADGEDHSEHYLKRRDGNVTLAYRDESGQRHQRELRPTDFRPHESILSQLKDPVHYREVTSVGFGLAGMHLYRQWPFGRNTPPRSPQQADLPNHSLMEDGRNLGMVLNRLERDSKAKEKFLTALRKLYDGIDDYCVQVEGGSAKVFLKEGNFPIPATRLSDGTLRYLRLLATLCQPVLPKLICIEEPEVGLHPDILPSLADLLREASERCQLIVTTHSGTLVDALSETPESIVICQKENGRTSLNRLNKDGLSHWLEKYRLGELWTSGELGGTRW